MKRLLVYSKKYWIQMIAAAISSVTASISTVMVIDILREIIDIISKGNMMQEIWYIILKIIIVICVGIVSNYMLVAMTGFVGAGLLKDFRNDAVNSLINASPEYINQCNYGDLMERMTEDIEGLAGFMSGYFKDCLYVPILTVVYSVYLISMNAPLAMICLFPLAIMVPLNVKLLKPIKLRQSQYVNELGLTNNNVDEAFAGAEIIKSYNIQEKMMNRYKDALYKTFKTSNETDLAQYKLEPISRAIQEVPMALAICVGGVLVFRNAITMGVLIAYISIIKKLIEPLSGCYQLVVRSQTALVSVSRVFDVIDIVPEEELSAGMKSDEMITDFPLISFNDITFGYGDEKVLINVSFDVKKGESIAFVGESGSGKSTIIKLISRQILSKNGGIFYEGIDYYNFTSNEIRKKLALISQEATLFPMSIADNIRIGNPDVSNEKIRKALKMSGCEEFIKALPEGISLIISALTAFVSIKINQSIKKYAKKVQKKSTKLSMLLSDIISGFVTLKMNSGTKVVLNYFYEENEASSQSEKDRVKMEALFEIVAFLLGIIGSFGTIIVGGWLVSEGRVDYGTLMAVVTLQMGVSNAMQRLGNSIAALTTSLVRAGHVFDFMESEMEEEITWFTAGNGLERKNINVQNERDKAIDISNLHFSYNENDESRDKSKMRAQLNSKKMQISVGEKVMITGESGCGKSTLLKLIQGFYPVENGKIKILGKDINEYSLAELRNVITYVPQDSYLFEGTIAENIAFGWNEETAPVMDVIVSAAKKAHADEFIKDLPEGYNTKVAEGGTNLSGGQRQRISIARAFMKEAPIVLMDEPLSALDTYSENAVLEAMSVFMKKKTVIMVSHRMTGAEKFNRVVRMD